jgi:hypothetical protein
MFPKRIHPIALLTGAGFTRNFGAYLSSDFWAQTFNNPAVIANPTLQQLLKNQRYEFDFELIYGILRRDHPNEFQIYKVALERIYQDIDGLVQEAKYQPATPVDLNALYSWLSRFAGRDSNAGFIFTLNQDLFFERHGGNAFHPNLPGVPELAEAGNVRSSNVIRSATLPTSVSKEYVWNHLGPFNVMKLHGSCNWKSAVDGQDAMALGFDKDQSLEKEPLLCAYKEVFKDVILSGEVKQLWVVGYSFRDEHINQILAQGIKDKGLELFIINTTSPGTFFLELYGTLPRRVVSTEPLLGHVLHWGVRGYHPYEFRTIFSGSKSSAAFKSIDRQLKMAEALPRGSGMRRK